MRKRLKTAHPTTARLYRGQPKEKLIIKKSQRKKQGQAKTKPINKDINKLLKKLLVKQSDKISSDLKQKASKFTLSVSKK